jgi:hypothetical protein
VDNGSNYSVSRSDIRNTRKIWYLFQKGCPFFLFAAEVLKLPEERRSNRQSSNARFETGIYPHKYRAFS